MDLKRLSIATFLFFFPTGKNFELVAIFAKRLSFIIASIVVIIMLMSVFCLHETAQIIRMNCQQFDSVNILETTKIKENFHRASFICQSRVMDLSGGVLVESSTLQSSILCV